MIVLCTLFWAGTPGPPDLVSCVVGLQVCVGMFVTKYAIVQRRKLNLLLETQRQTEKSSMKSRSKNKQNSNDIVKL